MFFLFVYWHPQWYMYALPLLLYMGCYLHNEWEYALYYAGTAFGFMLYSLAAFNTNDVNAMLVWNSLLGKRMSGNHIYVSLWISEHITEYCINAGYTVFMAAFAILIILYYLDVKDKRKTEFIIPRKVPLGIWGMIAFVPTLIYYVVIFYCYFR